MTSTLNIHPNRYLRFARRLRWFFAVYLPPRHTGTIETENGLLSFDSKDRQLGRTLHVYRHFEIDGIEFVREWLHRNHFLANEPSGCVLDVGGYVGMICIAMMRRNIFEKAVAFEPYPESFRLLQRNIRQNRLEGKIAAVNLALSDRNSTLEFELSPKNFGDHRVRVLTEDGAQNEMQRRTTAIEAVRFDDFLEQGRLGAPPTAIKLIWMDIQGHEGRFLAGARNFLRTHARVPVFMEFWPYGIRRSGITRERFCEIVSETFTHFHAFDGGTEIRHAISDMSVYFSEHDGPDIGSHIILIRDP
jgi:FkbM family methyltransferase